jgi:O-antigen ligase
VAVAWRGGYGQDARALVAALAGLAALAALAWAPAEAGRAARSPVVLSLAALALLSAVSAAWTIGSGSQAVRDGAAVLAIAATVVAAAAVRPPWLHAGLLLGAALGVAVLGLVAAIATSDPLALEICGTWRPAGPFEYPPTLGLVCAGALPVAVAVASRGARVSAAMAPSAAAAAWLLAATIALTANRTAVAFAGAALVAAVWLAPRRIELGPVALAVIGAAAASAFVVGSHLGDAGIGRLVLAAAFVVVPSVVAGRRSPAGIRRGQWIAVVAAAAVVGTAASVVADRGTGCQGDASHGRVGIWKAAVATASDRPLQGFGSGTFLAASRQHQLEHRPRPTRFAHNLPLEAWAELGVLGLIAVLAWYAAVGATVVRAVRKNPYAYLLVPAVAAFPLANLLDWPWHLLGAGMLWAVATGAVIASNEA